MVYKDMVYKYLSYKNESERLRVALGIASGKEVVAQNKAVALLKRTAVNSFALEPCMKPLLSCPFVRCLVFVLTATLYALSAPAYAATPESIDKAKAEAPEVNNGQDFTNPLARFDLRYGHQKSSMAPPGHDDMRIVTLRMDKPFVLSPEWLVTTRIDLPFMSTNIPNQNDNLHGKTHFGMSDALMQALLVHIPNKDFAWAAGAQVIFPTAGEEEMGTGRYRVVPTVGARWGTGSILRGSWVALAVRWDKDFAKSRSNASKVNELQFAPVVNIWLPHYWFINLFPSPDIRYNMGEKRKGDSGRWFIPANFMLGKMLDKNTVGSIEVGIPVVKDYQVYDFKLEMRLGFLF
jgi:hypothetical protein